jgi:protein-tyrosine-phosphatase
LTRDLIDWADLILVMGYKHYEQVIDIQPEAAVKTFLLKEYKKKVKYNEISDPVGKDLKAYEAAAANMLSSLRLIARDIKRRFRKTEGSEE